MTKKTLISALAIMLLTSILFAQGGTPMHKSIQVPGAPNQDPRLKARPVSIDDPKPMMEMLNLSEQQKAKIETLRLNHQKQMIDLQAGLDKIKLDLNEAIKKDKFAEAKKLNTSLYNKMKEIADARLDHKQAMLKELNDDQKAIMKEHFQQGSGMCGEGSGQMLHGRKGNQGMHGQGMRCQGMQQMGNARQHRMRQGAGMGCGMQMRMRNQECDDCADEQSEMPKPPKPSTPGTATEK